ncbi:hypothetical protein [Methylobacterium sp. WL120]|uniref:hypothetical protein n=1 Tax=Methylobacterium sp. WL120 TaxID=2603887 RepID=UPI0011CCC40E|nr:hypothetical protein [Methylobacterium sp. WL120]TXM68205.1 hypothetical protein FV229_08550 [Methylobacterium sp. WL120]
MADKSKSISGAEKAPEPVEDGKTPMFKVKLNKVVRLHGMDFKPNQSVWVDQATLDAMGDAVDDAKPV